MTSWFDYRLHAAPATDGEPAENRLWQVLPQSYRVRYYFRMKVTVKGQITIPQALRERFGLHPDTEMGLWLRRTLCESNRASAAAGRRPFSIPGWSKRRVPPARN